MGIDHSTALLRFERWIDATKIRYVLIPLSHTIPHMKHIRDPLYGYIGVSDAELRVIGTQPVQRLRRVHQLGLSSTVYPGATHMRFEHSLGVMHLAGEMATALDLPPEEVQAYRLAGLLHDVGHAPFSHATERIMEDRLGISHEEQSCRLVDDIAAELEDAFPANPELVKTAIRGESEYPLVAGPVDVDRMDYLRRDAYETGIPHGEIDTETIIRFAEVRDGEVVFSHKSRQAIRDLFNARAAMNNSVYQHHTSKIVEAMLHHAVEDYLDHGPHKAATLLRWDDFMLHTKLSEYEGVGGHLYDRLASRDLYKRALVLDEETYGRDALCTLARDLDVPTLEHAIADAAGVPSEVVLVDPPHTPSKAEPEVRLLWGDEVRVLDDVSALTGTASLGVYTPAEHREVVGEAARDLLL